MNPEVTCRVCLKEQSSLKSLFLPESNPLSDRINKIFNLDFLISFEDSDLPTKICLECLTELHHGLQFYEKITNSQERLLLMVQKVEIVEPNEVISEVFEEEFLVEQFEVTSTELIEEPMEEQEEEEQEEEEEVEPKKSKVDEFICKFCSKVYNKKASLMYHLKTKHDSDRPHVCSSCNKKFAIKSDLTRHERIHTSEKRFICSFCGKKFTDRSTHLKHERVHTGVKPFVCEVCNKAFTYSFVLRSHMLTHTGVKNFPCTICEKRFARKTKMKDHFVRVHKRKFGKEDEEILKNLLEELSNDDTAEGEVKVEIAEAVNEVEVYS